MSTSKNDYIRSCIQKWLKAGADCLFSNCSGDAAAFYKFHKALTYMFNDFHFTGIDIPCAAVLLPAESPCSGKDTDDTRLRQHRSRLYCRFHTNKPDAVMASG